MGQTMGTWLRIQLALLQGTTLTTHRAPSIRTIQVKLTCRRLELLPCCLDAGSSRGTQIPNYTLHGLILDFFEGLEAPGEQGFEVKPVLGVGGREAMFNRGTKSVKGGRVAGIETFFAHKAPEALNEVQMRGIGREIQEFNVEGRRILVD